MDLKLDQSVKNISFNLNLNSNNILSVLGKSGVPISWKSGLGPFIVRHTYKSQGVKLSNSFISFPWSYFHKRRVNLFIVIYKSELISLGILWIFQRLLFCVARRISIKCHDMSDYFVCRAFLAHYYFHTQGRVEKVYAHFLVLTWSFWRGSYQKVFTRLCFPF